MIGEMEKINVDKMHFAIRKWFDPTDRMYWDHEKMQYEEFILLTFVYDYVKFYYNDNEYAIEFGQGDKSLFTTVKIDSVSKQETITTEEYSTVFELLDKVRIDGKTIKDIWDDVDI